MATEHGGLDPYLSGWCGTYVRSDRDSCQLSSPTARVLPQGSLVRIFTACILNCTFGMANILATKLCLAEVCQEMNTGGSEAVREKPHKTENLWIVI